MDHRPLGNTGLTVSVAGLGCGGNSRLGLGRGASFEECVGGARAAIDLGVNFLDSAEVYGTEEIVGAAMKEYDRDRLVISTAVQGREHGGDGEAKGRGVATPPGRVEADDDRAMRRPTFKGYWPRRWRR